jgi:hypothetical protein
VVAPAPRRRALRPCVGCGRRVRLAACETCWRRLPVPLRQALARVNRPNTLEWTTARDNARRWLDDHAARRARVS